MVGVEVSSLSAIAWYDKPSANNNRILTRTTKPAGNDCERAISSISVRWVDVRTSSSP
jgi:hypothetical protein